MSVATQRLVCELVLSAVLFQTVHSMFNATQLSTFAELNTCSLGLVETGTEHSALDS